MTTSLTSGSANPLLATYIDQCKKEGVPCLLDVVVAVEDCCKKGNQQGGTRCPAAVLRAPVQSYSDLVTLLPLLKHADFCFSEVDFSGSGRCLGLRQRVFPDGGSRGASPNAAQSGTSPSRATSAGGDDAWKHADEDSYPLDSASGSLACTAVEDILQALDFHIEPVVKELRFADCFLGDPQAITISNILSMSGLGIRVLDLSGNFIRKLGGMALGQALAATSISGTAATPTIAGSPSQQIPLSCLTELSLHNNAIGREGAAAVAQALKTNTSLKHLHLAQNNIGDTGAIHIAKMLRVNGTLRTLDLAGNRIASHGGGEIARAMAFRFKVAKESARRASVSPRRRQTTISLPSEATTAGDPDSGFAATGDLPGIRWLNLRDNDLNDAAAVFFADVVLHCSSLTHLLLGYNSDVRLLSTSAALLQAYADAVENSTPADLNDSVGALQLPVDATKAGRGDDSASPFASGGSFSAAPTAPCRLRRLDLMGWPVPPNAPNGAAAANETGGDDGVPAFAAALAAVLDAASVKEATTDLGSSLKAQPPRELVLDVELDTWCYASSTGGALDSQRRINNPVADVLLRPSRTPDGGVVGIGINTGGAYGSSPSLLVGPEWMWRVCEEEDDEDIDEADDGSTVLRKCVSTDGTAVQYNSRGVVRLGAGGQATHLNVSASAAQTEPEPTRISQATQHESAVKDQGSGRQGMNQSKDGQANRDATDAPATARIGASYNNSEVQHQSSIQPMPPPAAGHGNSNAVAEREGNFAGDPPAASGIGQPVRPQKPAEALELSGVDAELATIINELRRYTQQQQQGPAVANDDNDGDERTTVRRDFEPSDTRVFDPAPGSSDLQQGPSRGERSDGGAVDTTQRQGPDPSQQLFGNVLLVLSRMQLKLEIERSYQQDEVRALKDRMHLLERRGKLCELCQRGMHTVRERVEAESLERLEHQRRAVPAQQQHHNKSLTPYGGGQPGTNRHDAHQYMLVGNYSGSSQHYSGPPSSRHYTSTPLSPPRNSHTTGLVATRVAQPVPGQPGTYYDPYGSNGRPVSTSPATASANESTLLQSRSPLMSPQ